MNTRFDNAPSVTDSIKKIIGQRLLYSNLKKNTVMMALRGTGTNSVPLMCIGSTTFNSIVYNFVRLFEEDTVVDLHNVAILITFCMLLPIFQYGGSGRDRAQ